MSFHLSKKKNSSQTVTITDISIKRKKLLRIKLLFYAYFKSFIFQSYTAEALLITCI
jgi:hypothetical protein